MNCCSKYIYKQSVVPVKLLLPLLLVYLFSCNEAPGKRNIEPAFYYWKSVLNISDFELKRLDSLHTKTLYIKFFDVDWNNSTSQPAPVAKLQHTGYRLPVQFEVIPVVFITNECIRQLDTAATGKLADNIFSLIRNISHVNGFSRTREIQVDCDWTAGSRSSYFSLLQKIGALCKHEGITLSCTIRLHQVKFMSKSGVPPVDRGLLMCYNMGNLKNPATGNSIIETEEMEQYTGNLTAYPLPLDVAFPLFDWKVLFRDHIYSGLVEQLPNDMLTGSFVSVSGNRYTILQDTILAGYTFKKGDVLRDEQSSYATVLSAAASIGKRLKNTAPRVSLYHLDSVILKKYSLHELETVYNSLR